ncbi:MAG: prepilin-type N-terminal cleavage/methylation domain-containing protein, partial [Proteobacteria bacterium]|nr:prepilin-type N-terminal cleavage/methylation domain-containing protein [Pseudomonadota bacterium]
MIKRAIKRNGERGFTMIELVMVIVLIGIVAGVAAPVLFGNSSSID